MSKIITIAGVDRTSDVLINGFVVDKTLTMREDYCNMVLCSGLKPNTGDLVEITDTSLVFGGIIDKVADVILGGDKYGYSVSVRDYTYLLDKLIVVEDYQTGRLTNKRADEMVIDIINKYCTGFTYVNVQPNAPEIDFMQFVYINPSECIKQICAYVGWSWYIDYNKDVHFFNPQILSEPAPFELVNNPPDNTAFRNFVYNIDTQDLRNKVFVLGGKYLSSTINTQEWVADGVARSWPLSWVPYGTIANPITLDVVEVPKTIGIEGVDDEALFDYLYNIKDSYLRCSGGTATPIDGATMTLNALQQLDIITVVEDIESQEAIALAQGGDGVYEHSITDTKIVTIEAAEAMGNDDLSNHANPVTTGGFLTSISGFKTGQILSINLPLRGIVNQFVIQKVTATMQGQEFIYQISFGGRLYGIADVLKALINTQKNMVATSYAQIIKIITTNEDISMVDAWDSASHDANTPWYIEDSIKFKLSNVTATTTSALYTAIGTMLIISTSDSRGWGLSEYYNGIIWTEIVVGQAIELSNTVLQVRSNRNIEVYNFKKAYDETDTICGEVICLGA